MRILTIVSGIMLILTGLWCFANQGVTFAGLAFVLGLVMLLNGIIGVVAFIKMKDRLERMEWALSEAILAIILGCVVLSNQLVTDLIIIMFFGMWMLFSGCNQIVGALVLKRQDDISWNWTIGLGIISALAGIYSFYNSSFAGLTLGILVGIFFLIQGCNVLAFGIALPHAKKPRNCKNYERSKEKKK